MVFGLHVTSSDRDLCLVGVTLGRPCPVPTVMARSVKKLRRDEAPVSDSRN